MSILIFAMMKPTQIVVLGGIITILGALVTLYGQYRVRKDKKQLLTTIDSKNDLITKLGEKQLIELDSLRSENGQLRNNIENVKQTNVEQT